jgi:organic hydroperoxide reductase OsmC/OhrA
MSQIVGHFNVEIERIDGYEFRVRFDKEHYPELVMDEPAPLGNDTAPNAARVLAAAIGNCLSASLAFCLSKAKVELQDLKSDVRVELVRNEAKRLRIGKVDVTLHPTLAKPNALQGCLDIFEDFCIVTQSVRQGIDVHVHVDTPANHDSASEARP